MIPEVFVSLQSFLLGVGTLSYFYFYCGGFGLFIDIEKELTKWLSIDIDTALHTFAGLYCFIFYVCINLLLCLIYKGLKWQVAVRACFLGTIFGTGIIYSFLSPLSWQAFGWYIMVLSFFHFSEYLCTGVVNPKSLSIDTFLLNHSIAYWVAAVASWIEFFLEAWLIPPMKDFIFLKVFGVIMCIVGECIRKMSMITASTNFNHIVQVHKQEDHELVTWGIYGIFRHPSYVGWFLWSIGTQIILSNPVCLIAYTVTSWSFFKSRIYYEEITLLKFFGQQYMNYKKKVCTGLPFIYGYTVKQE